MKTRVRILNFIFDFSFVIKTKTSCSFLVEVGSWVESSIIIFQITTLCIINDYYNDVILIEYNILRTF
jgi:hypothetical protein